MSERENIRVKLAAILEEETGTSLEELASSEDLPLREGLNIDSVDLVGVVMRVEAHYRVRLSSEELSRIITVGHLVDMIQMKRPEPPDASNWGNAEPTALNQGAQCEQPSVVDA